MAIRQFDELKGIRQEIDLAAASRMIEAYFDEMALDDEDIEKRIKAANDFMRFFFALFLAMRENKISRDECIQRITDEYVRILDRYDYRPNMGHIDNLAEAITDNTLENIDSEWYTSVDRSVKIAETETNNSANYEGLQEAIDNGFTQKTWVTMQDNKVRETHRAIDGMTIGIDELFPVGNAEMRYPCDEEVAWDFPEESVNCRCVLQYS